LSKGEAEYNNYTAAVDKADKEIAEIDDRIDKNNKVINTTKEQINSLNKKLNQLELTDEKHAFDELKMALKAAGVEGVETATSLDQLKEKVEALDT
jgi:peptidoglycan hydrolase CwlO-like protein